MIFTPLTDCRYLCTLVECYKQKCYAMRMNVSRALSYVKGIQPRRSAKVKKIIFMNENKSLLKSFFTILK